MQAWENLPHVLSKKQFLVFQQVVLSVSEIGRSLEEDTPLHATHKRLSRNLAEKSLGSCLLDKSVLSLGAKRVMDKTLLLIDPSELQKKYARKMQYPASVRDASKKAIGKGYWMCDVVD